MRKIIVILSIVMLLFIAFDTASVFAFGGGFDPSQIGNKSDAKLKPLKEDIKKITKTALLLLQLASVGGILVLGVKYMFSSANQRADYKKGLVMAVIGLMLVFGASTVATFVVDAFEEAIDVNQKEEKGK